jgi:hypothetical protein
MPKKIVQDVVPPERRSIRNISVSKESKKSSSYNEASGSKEEVSVPVKSVSKSAKQKKAKEKLYDDGKERKPSRLRIWVVAFVLVLACAFSISFFFVNAQVKVTPKRQVATIHQTFTAKKDILPPGLSYEVVTLSKEETKEVTASGEEKADIKASGTILIYNKYSTSPQTLVKNTRFESAGGLIYRINESVIVPGKTTKDGEEVPGSIRATVYADQPGEKYNIGLSDFTIPGFKGDPRYKTFFARSDSKMQGGFSGIMKKVKPEDLVTVKSELETKLKDELMKAAQAQVPKNFVLYDDASIFDFEMLPQVTSGTDKAIIKEKGIIYGVLFNSDLLSQQIVQNATPTNSDTNISVTNIKDLEFHMQKKESFNPITSNEVSFSLQGSARIIWKYSPQKLKEDLKGKMRNDLGKILSSYTSIEKAEVVIRPFWRRSFPDDLSKIEIREAVSQ